jgi:4-hydroxy-3-polyprenylbenzoate decarboxylase
MRELVRLFEGQGELSRIDAEVDPVLEVAAITDRVCKEPGGGRVLCFEKVRGHDFPVLTNLFGSPRRTARALGVENVEELAGRLAADLARSGKGSAAERLRRLTGSGAYLSEPEGEAPCREETMSPPDLTRLPALKSWPMDGGPFLTLPLVFTRDPETGERNCGMYRMQIFDDRRAGLHWRRGSDASRHYEAYARRGERMPVAVALGGDPALIYAAGAPLPPGVDETAFAGWIRGGPVAMTPCGGGLAVPAAAEFVLEGYAEPGEEMPEGPFGNHTGRYVAAEPCPVFHLTGITHRRRPIYPATVVGPPPMEDCWLARASQRLFLPLLRLDFPEIVDIHLPLETIFHGCALVAVRKGTPGRELLRSLWREGFLKSSRLLVLLDEEVDIRDLSAAWWHAVNRIDPARDVIVDGARIGIDATALDPGPPVGPDDVTRKLVERRWGEYGIE